MTHFLKDILRQPAELRWTLDHLHGAGAASLSRAVEAVRKTRHVYLTGIGSSWHAALNVGAMFFASGQPVYMQDASELVQFAAIPRDSVLIVISRSGRSVEIVNLAAKAKAAGATVIGVTNAPEGDLAKTAQIPLVVPIAMDHAISVNTYCTLALAAGALANSVAGYFTSSIADSLSKAFAETAKVISNWQQQVESSEWLAPHSTSYFLARGSSLGSCYEARLLWEEGVKSPATAMGSGSFRHGPQEIVTVGARFGVWIDAVEMREQDLAMARDLRKLGASVMSIGQNIPADAGDLVFQLPAIPSPWQFLIDSIPAQLVAERLARLGGVDSDTFRLCSYIVENDGGLVGKAKDNA